MAASGSVDWPLFGTRDRAYIDTEAETRIRAWASSDGSGDKDKLDWEKYASVHFWRDSTNKQSLSSYKLKFCDVMDGKAFAIWHGVTAAAAVMQGARGGVNIPDADRSGVKRKIESYYAKAKDTFDDDSIEVPWAEGKSMSDGTEYIECNLRELKFVGPGKEMTFAGYGAVFGNTDSYGDVIQHGAFAKTIQEAKQSGRWPAMLSQHGAFGLTSQDLTPIGAWQDLREDSTGLYVEGKLADTIRGQEIHTLMMMSPRPAIDGLSIGYRPKAWKMVTRSDGTQGRDLTEIGLKEISPVTFPANDRALVASVKAGEISTLADAERLLRRTGFSKADALDFVSKIKQLGRSDSDPPGDRSDSDFADLVSLLKQRPRFA